MATPVSLPGFEGRTLTVESSVWSGQPRLTLDGIPIKPTSQTGVIVNQAEAPISPPAPGVKPAKGKRNEFVLRQNDGREVLVRVKPAFPDPAPMLEVNGQTIRTARPLTPFEWIWAGFPLVLLALGGAIGGGIGAFAAVTNISLIRDESKGALRYVLCAIITFFAFVAYFSLAVALQALLKR